MEVRQPEFTRNAAAEDRQLFLRNRVELLPGSDNGLREYMRRAAMAAGRAHRGGASSCLRQPGQSAAGARHCARAGIRRSPGHRRGPGPHRSPTADGESASVRRWSGCGLGAGLSGGSHSAAHLSACGCGGRVCCLPHSGWARAGLRCGSHASDLTGLRTSARHSRLAHRNYALAQRQVRRAFSPAAFLFAGCWSAFRLRCRCCCWSARAFSSVLLRNLENLGPGFPTDHLLTFTINPSLSGYSDERNQIVL